MRMEAFTNETQQTILYLNIVYRQFHMYMYFQTIKKIKQKHNAVKTISCRKVNQGGKHYSEACVTSGFIQRDGFTLAPVAVPFTGQKDEVGVVVIRAKTVLIFVAVWYRILTSHCKKVGCSKYMYIALISKYNLCVRIYVLRQDILIQ